MEKINTISTAVIAFSTIVGIIGAYFYNLSLLGYGISSIIFFELLLMLSVLVFIYYVGGLLNE
ncbi:MAG: hypothetical protein AABX29_07625 [Nanoarchaeota archaeon]